MVAVIGNQTNGFVWILVLVLVMVLVIDIAFRNDNWYSIGFDIGVDIGIDIVMVVLLDWMD